MTQDPAGPFPPVEARGATVRYGDVHALDGVDVRLPRGAVTAIVGPNGSGKTTLLEVLAGITEPDEGEVRLEGTPAREFGRRVRARRIGLLPQSPRSPPGLTVRELVARGRYPHHGPLGRRDDVDEAAVDEALEDANLAEIAHRPLGTLSGGETRRAWVGLALAQRPGVLLMDEPTAHLDLRYELETLDIIENLRDEHGLTVGVVLHDLNLAADVADRLQVLSEGEVAARGDPADVLDADLVDEVFRADVMVREHPETGDPWVLPRRGGRAAAAEEASSVAIRTRQTDTGSP